MPSITNPVALDSTLQDVVSKTQGLASKIKTPQTDWNQTDTTSMSYIANKPEIYDPNDTDRPSITDLAEEAADIFANIATVEASTTASKAYVQGDYLILDGKFYKVTAAIASGGTITVDTNVTQTTIAAELKAALS